MGNFETLPVINELLNPALRPDQVNAFRPEQINAAITSAKTATADERARLVTAITTWLDSTKNGAENSVRDQAMTRIQDLRRQILTVNGGDVINYGTSLAGETISSGINTGLNAAGEVKNWSINQAIKAPKSVRELLGEGFTNFGQGVTEGDWRKGVTGLTQAGLLLGGSWYGWKKVKNSWRKIGSTPGVLGKLGQFIKAVLWTGAVGTGLIFAINGGRYLINDKLKPALGVAPSPKPSDAAAPAETGTTPETPPSTEATRAVTPPNTAPSQSDVLPGTPAEGPKA